jgi:hypothetical protein
VPLLSENGVTSKLVPTSSRIVLVFSKNGVVWVTACIEPRDEVPNGRTVPLTAIMLLLLENCPFMT